MKFWTVQTKNVLDIIEEEGIFQPDFHKNRYLEWNPDLQDLYDCLLTGFNKNNGTHLPGVVFAFAQSDGKKIFSIKDSQSFYRFIQENKSVIFSLWNKLIENDAMIMELEYRERFNPIFIDINDFQFMMPPVMMLPPYTQQSVSRICHDINNGEITISEFPSPVMQAHLPYIKPENIVNIYRTFPFA